MQTTIIKEFKEKKIPVVKPGTFLVQRMQHLGVFFQKIKTIDI